MLELRYMHAPQCEVRCDNAAAWLLHVEHLLSTLQFVHIHGLANPEMVLLRTPYLGQSVYTAQIEKQNITRIHPWHLAVDPHLHVWTVVNIPNVYHA